MDEDEKAARFLDVTSRRAIHHHESLWEEEKHYTWWVYVVFAALIFVLSSQFISPRVKAMLLILESIFGIFISITGYRVVRREGEYFYNALAEQTKAMVALGLDKRTVHIANEERPLGILPDIAKQTNLSAHSPADFGEATSVFVTFFN